jgi:hypothetical protein
MSSSATTLQVGQAVRYAPDGIVWRVAKIEGRTVELRTSKGATLLDTVASVERAMGRLAVAL